MKKFYRMFQLFLLIFLKNRKFCCYSVDFYSIFEIRFQI